MQVHRETLSAILGPSWARFGPVLGCFVPSCRHEGAILGRLGAVLGLSWAVLGCLRPVLGRLEPVLGGLGRSLGGPGPHWGNLGASLEHILGSVLWSFSLSFGGRFWNQVLAGFRTTFERMFEAIWRPKWNPKAHLFWDRRFEGGCCKSIAKNSTKSMF